MAFWNAEDKKTDYMSRHGLHRPHCRILQRYVHPSIAKDYDNVLHAKYSLCLTQHHEVKAHEEVACEWGPVY